jgi:hypothetical protein
MQFRLTLVICLFVFAGYSFGLATDCTIYASPSGGGNGASAETPTTLTGANSASAAGSVICFKGGTYNLGSISPHGGSAGNHIKWEPYGDSPVVFSYSGVDAPGNFMINLSNQSYVDLVGFSMDGQNKSRACIDGTNANQITVSSTHEQNCGSGIVFHKSDYLTIDHNQITHGGYDTGIIQDPTGINIHDTCALDSYDGIHSVISNNIVSGQVDLLSRSTDGNGLTLDLGCSGTTTLTTTPATLWINNVVYMNGGRCFVGNKNTSVLFINNTCYNNMLETVPIYNNGGDAEVKANGTSGYVFANNIVHGWPGNVASISGRGYTNFSYESVNGATGSIYSNNSYFTLGLGSLNGGSSTTMFNYDPQFTNPPSVNSAGTGQYATAPDPASIGNAFTLQPTSPALKQGIDPTTIAGLSAQIKIDLARYVYKDINGVARAAGNWDLGAYQSSASVPAPKPPTGLTATVH